MNDSQPNIKFYKIKILKNFLQHISQAKTSLLDELVNNATDPVLYKRRIRMLKHISQYELQIIQKIQDFDTNDVQDLNVNILLSGLKIILNKSA